jgi:branched-chain amino acid transport system permease protein
LIGVVQSSLTASLTLAPYRTLTPFVFAIAALLWMARHRVVSIASGLRLSAGQAAHTQLVPGRLQLPISGGLVVLALVLVPALLSAYWIQVSTSVVIYIVVALGAGVLMGRVGLVSLCQVALLAVGGWVALRIGYATSLPFPVVLLCAGLVTAFLGVIVGLPALRLSGVYFALITLMAAGAITAVLTQINFPNGAGGFSGYSASRGGASLLRAPAIATSVGPYFRYVLVASAILFVFTVWHVRSKPGRAWAAMRQSEPAALATGINVTLYKLWAFALAAFITGVAGGLLAASAGGLSTYAFPTQNSITLLAVVLMGGMYSLSGAVIAGLLSQLLPALLTNWGVSSDVLLIVFGVGVLQVLATAPGGLAVQVPHDLSRLVRAVRGRGRSATRHAGEAPLPRGALKP